ncbi:NADP-dependent oxidoreductase domain-containing protein 1-like isoform X2 [Stylophora pistillata]|uniref:NADP-dependent oxidoreductase domain-containing protein 1 n=1 Tax=Stylophora pistillata TaxID=50429 RepID=A0A2B4RQF6_STYPI|nr:NADP-dependent oxidoreductase domain-containing protein 1-like isoform X2 [Stylophora pistillata]PFX18577.1 NADP-dependent oxidoreductase domain-containing protein 1 [Stylophora pistillata]
MAAVEDVTVNLPSLQFEAALTRDEKQMLYLRGRSHALTVSACAQAAFLVAVLNDARQKIVEIKYPVKKKSSKLLQEAPKRDPLLVGIIGCGRLGKQLANTILKFSDVHPEELFLSTRRPETLSALQMKGVHCGFDNIKVCSTVHMLFICCLPLQFPMVAKEIKRHLKCPVYVLVGGTPLLRIRQLLQYEEIIKPEFSWKKTDPNDDSNNNWNIGKDINEILREDTNSCDVTCPLNVNKDSAIVETGEEWAELAVLTFFNMCTEKELNMEQSVRLCNAVVFGMGPTDDPGDGISVDELISDINLLGTGDSTSDGKFFPRFDLRKISSGQSKLGNRLMEPNGSLRRMFVKRYRAVFDKFQYWKGVPTNVS